MRAWENEPNRKEWESHGLPCLILRGPVGALCGYVGVPEGHAAYGKPYGCYSYDEATDTVDRIQKAINQIEVHGGLTFAGEGDGKYRPAGYWWFGFDCAHCFDLAPVMLKYGHIESEGAVYRDMTYVTEQTEFLAKQLAAIGGDQS